MWIERPIGVDLPAGADGGIRTPTPLRVLGPKPSASARFRHVRECARVARGAGGSGSQDGVALPLGLVFMRSGLGRWPESESAVEVVELPSVVVYEVVAAAAEQAQVVDVGVAAGREPFDVVGFAPLNGCGAVGAAAVACREHRPLAGAGVPLGSAEPQGIAAGVEEGGQDLGSRR